MGTSSSSTVITKLLATFAGHCRATVISFHPKLASWALLVFSSTHKFDKVLIVFVETVVYLILGTSHTIMILTLAPQTIMLFACGAAIII